MTPDQLSAIKQRCEAATEGPWKATQWSDGDPIGWAFVSGPKRGSYRSVRYEGVRTSNEDAAFIAHARTDIPALCKEVERLQLELKEEREHATMLLAGYPDAETPTDIRILKQANADFAAEVERLRGALENLRPNIKCYLYNNSHSAVPRIALESWINMITAALASAPASDAAPDAPALSPSDQHEWEQAQELGRRSSQA